MHQSNNTHIRKKETNKQTRKTHERKDGRFRTSMKISDEQRATKNIIEYLHRVLIDRNSHSIALLLPNRPHPTVLWKRISKGENIKPIGLASITRPRVQALPRVHSSLKKIVSFYLVKKEAIAGLIAGGRGIGQGVWGGRLAEGTSGS